MEDQNEGKSKKTWVAPEITIIEGLDSSVEFLYPKDGNPSGGTLDGGGGDYQRG